MLTKNQAFGKRLKFAINGILKAAHAESSFQIQLLAALALVIFCVVDRPPAVWIAIFLICGVAVLALELVNTALENLIDHLHPSFNPRIGFVKDCLAGAVLVACCGSLGAFTAYFFR